MGLFLLQIVFLRSSSRLEPPKIVHPLAPLPIPMVVNAVCLLATIPNSAVTTNAKCVICAKSTAPRPASPNPFPAISFPRRRSTNPSRGFLCRRRRRHLPQSGRTTHQSLQSSLKEHRERRRAISCGLSAPSSTKIAWCVVPVAILTRARKTPMRQLPPTAPNLANFPRVAMNFLPKFWSGLLPNPQQYLHWHKLL
jgi:hypothetical protein